MKTSIEKMNDLLKIIESNCKGVFRYHSFYVLCKGLALGAEKGKTKFVEHYLNIYFAKYINRLNVDENGNWDALTEVDPDYVIYDITSTIKDFGYAVATVNMETAA